MRTKTGFIIVGITLTLLLVGYPRTAQCTVAVSVPDSSGPPGGAVTIPIEVDDATGIAGGDIIVTFDPDILTPTGAQITTFTQDFLLVDNPMNGQIVIALAKSTRITSGNGSIFNINFDIDASVTEGDTSPVTFARVALYDENADPIGSTTTDGTFAVNALSPLGEGGGEGGGGAACFIATAAYGTPLAEEVRVLCELRDKYLLTNKIGEELVSFYYKNSPTLANYIRDRESLKAIVRMGLKPAIYFSRFMSGTTSEEKLATLFGILLFSALALGTLKKRKVSDKT